MLGEGHCALPHCEYKRLICSTDREICCSLILWLIELPEEHKLSPDLYD